MEKEKDSSWFSAGAAAVGAAVGTGIGAVVGGPVGAAGGAALGSLIQSTFQWIGKEIKERQLSKQEEKKNGTVYELAKAKIDENIKAGKRIRNDEFFVSNNDERSSAEEITEETLFAAQRESEEKKIPFIANLYANCFFDEELDSSLIFQLLRMAEHITYRQLQILAVIGGFQLSAKEVGGTPFRASQCKELFGYKSISIATDIFELYRMGLLQSKSIILDIPGFTPADLSVGGCGALLYNHMELSTMPFDASTIEIVQLLCDKPVVEYGPHRITLKKDRS